MSEQRENFLADERPQAAALVGLLASYASGGGRAADPAEIAHSVPHMCPRCAVAHDVHQPSA